MSHAQNIKDSEQIIDVAYRTLAFFGVCHYVLENLNQGALSRLSYLMARLVIKNYFMNEKNTFYKNNFRQKNRIQ